jgi:hypothetical protein
MSPDEQIAARLIERAIRRARALLVAEAAAWAAAIAATIALGPTHAAAVIVIALVAGGTVAWLRRSAIERAVVVRALEHAEPSSRNLFVTASELTSGDLPASPQVRARVFAAAAAIAPDVDLGRALPSRRAVRAAIVASVVWSIAGISLWLGRSAAVAPRLAGSRSPSASASSSGGVLHVAVAIDPPGYTGLPRRTLNDPAQIEALEGSVANVVMGSYAMRTVLRQTGYIAIGEGAARRTLPVVVTTDALPAAAITAPGRDLVYAEGNARIAFEARATDDFGLRALTLRFTKVSGSGEQFDFQDGEIPLAITRDSARQWRGAASRSLAELQLKEGDMLVYRAVAADARPGDGSASSDAFFIEISKLGAAGGDAFTLPEEETRYALSQQMLIIKTERLHRQRAAMAADGIRDASLNLAVEQRMIRAEFVFMLGGEIEDEEVEAAQSTELQEGRLQNRGQRDLRAATIAMSQAEKLLTDANLPAALTAERAAVAALQRAFTRDRYILRALASRTTLDASRRLTGDVSTAADWRRSPREVPENRRAARLQDLLRGVAALSEADAAATFESRALVLAEEALRVDAASASLRQAATELQRAAGARDATDRQRALAAASAAVVDEARRSNAGAPLQASPTEAPLAGALSDATRAFQARDPRVPGTSTNQRPR